MAGNGEAMSLVSYLLQQMQRARLCRYDDLFEAVILKQE
jgi:hypothetical protein